MSNKERLAAILNGDASVNLTGPLKVLTFGLPDDDGDDIYHDLTDGGRQYTIPQLREIAQTRDVELIQPRWDGKPFDVQRWGPGKETC